MNTNTTPSGADASSQVEHLDAENHRLRRAMQKIMARLTDLLDEDQFGNVESIVTEAGVEPPEPAAPVHPGDDAMFELWWADHMPNASQADAWAEWCSLRANQTETQPAAQQEDALDAARYRWLRSAETGHCKVGGLFEVVGDGGQFSLKCTEELDAAIDAAMKDK